MVNSMKVKHWVIHPQKSHLISGLYHRGAQASQNGDGGVGHVTYWRAGITN
jgi:hypothetical protein